MTSCKHSDNEHDFTAQECANSSRNSANPACWPTVQITESMPGTQGQLIPGSSLPAVIITMEQLLHQCSKFLRIKLFKAKAPSPTCGTAYHLNTAGRQKFNQCQHMHFQVQSQPWQGRQDVKWEAGREHLLLWALREVQRVWCLGLWELGRWRRAEGYRKEGLGEVSCMVSGGTIGCFYFMILCLQLGKM